MDDLDLNPLLVQADPGKNKRYCTIGSINKVPSALDEKIYEDIKNSIAKKNSVRSSYKIKNVHRAVGTRLSHYIFKNFNIILISTSLFFRGLLLISIFKLYFDI